MPFTFPCGSPWTIISINISCGITANIAIAVVVALIIVIIVGIVIIVVIAIAMVIGVGNGIGISSIIQVVRSHFHSRRVFPEVCLSFSDGACTFQPRAVLAVLARGR